MQLRMQRKRNAISAGAEEHRAKIKPYPSINVWLNPLTRGLARRIAHENWMRTVDEIDFAFEMHDAVIGDVACIRYTTEATTKNNRRILYIHGGAFVAGSPRVNAATILPICHLSGREGVGVDYTLLPEGRFPVAINEVDAVYCAMLADDPESDTIMVSDSAGCTIALACLMRWRDEGVKLPSGAVMISPVIDGEGVSDTQITIDGHDPLISSNGGKTIRRLFEFYAPDMKLTDPRVSPIYGDFTSLTPILVQVGSREVNLGDAARLAEAARRAGVESHLHVFDGMFHLFHMHRKLEEARAAHDDIAAFIAARDRPSNEMAWFKRA